MSVLAGHRPLVYFNCSATHIHEPTVKSRTANGSEDLTTPWLPLLIPGFNGLTPLIRNFPFISVLYNLHLLFSTANLKTEGSTYFFSSEVAVTCQSVTGTVNEWSRVYMSVTVVKLFKTVVWSFQDMIYSFRVISLEFLGS